MPIERTGKAEMLLSEEQIQAVSEWAYQTPGARDWAVLKAKLEEMGVKLAMGSVLKFKEDRLEPGMQNLATIRAAAQFASQVGEALGSESTDAITRGANLIQQQAAFDWALKHKQNGTFDLDDPIFLQTFIEVSKATRSGLVAVDRKAITDARVQTLESQLRAEQEKREQAVAAADTLSQPQSQGMTVKARNALRLELGLAPLEEPA